MTRTTGLIIPLAALTLGLAACQDGAEIGDPNSGDPQPVEDGEGAGSNMDSDAQDVLGALETRPDYSTLVSAIEASGLSDRLNGDEPLTLFAPSNEAFDGLPATKLEQLVAIADNEELRRLLSVHVVPQALGRAAIERAISEGDGEAQYGTLGGETLTITKSGDNFVITGPNGGRATIETADIKAANGIVHGIDTVLQPKPRAEDDEAAMIGNEA